MEGRTQAGSGQPLWRLEHWLLILLILLAFGRGVWALGDKSLWWDESLSLHRAQGTLDYVLSNKIVLTDTIYSVDTIDNHPPLYFLLLWGTVRLLGNSEFVLRFPSLVFAVLLVPLLYVSGRRLVDRWTGLGAAALAALSPMYLWYGQEARMYTMLAFLSLLSFYLFVRAFWETPESLDLRHRWQWVAAYGLVTLCLVLTHHLSSLLIGFQLLVLGLLFLRRARRHRALMLVMGVVAVLVVASAVYAFVTLPRPKGGAGFRFMPLWELLRDVTNSFSLGLSVDVGDWWVLLIDLVFVLFLVLGFARLVRPGAPGRWRRSGWLLAGYLLIPIGLIYGLSFYQPAYMNSRHLILLTPAFFLLVASGLTLWRGRGLVVALLGWLLVVGGMVYSSHSYFSDPAYDKDQHREWGAYLRHHVRPGDVVVVDPPHIEQLYHYYGDAGVPWVGLPLLSGRQAETESKLEELLQTYDRLWLAFSHTPPWGDRRRFPEQWLNENAYRMAYQGFESYASNVLVAGYLRDWPHVPDLPQDAEPLPVRYSPALRLEGYRLVSPAETGRTLHVQLFWATDELGPEQISAELRLVDAEGHAVARSDRCPFDGLYPMWQWQPDLVLQDEHEVPIPAGTPPGSYHLELRLMSRPDGCAGGSGPAVPPLTAAPGVQRGDALSLGEVQVGRGVAAASVLEPDIDRGRRVTYDGLALLGETLSATELRPGERLEVGLYWQALRDGPPDARFRLRLVDASGEIRQEALIRPAGETYPASLWLADERWLGRFWLGVPQDAPAGRYRLELVPEPPLQRSGLGSTLRRLLGLGEGAVALGEIDVLQAAAPPTPIPAAEIPLPSGLDIAQPSIHILGDRVRFLGYDLESGEVRAGEPLTFTLYWQALNPMNTSYSVFTHLLGAQDEILGQRDGVPQGGAHPTTQWQPGEVVIDIYSFVVVPEAPPGQYLLEVGLYHPTGGVRLPVQDEAGQPVPHDRILLGPVSVTANSP